MKGIVFGATRQRADRELENIIEKYEIMKIPIVARIKNSAQNTASFKNGDYWIAVSADANARGHVVNVAYIDEEIPPEVINIICLPCIKALPYNAIYYFGQEI